MRSKKNDTIIDFSIYYILSSLSETNFALIKTFMPYQSTPFKVDDSAAMQGK